MQIKPKSRSKNVIIQEMKDEVLIYDIDTNKVVCLNQTAKLIWKKCDGNRSISSIAKEVGKELGKTIDNELVWLAINQLNAGDLLSNGEGVENRFEGLSRREVIKKIGITSMVSLPIVSSVVAPNAVAAQSVTCNQPIGVCTASNTVNVCPPECTGSTINATFYDIDATCNPASVTGMNSFLCNGTPRVFNEFYIIDSIT